MKIKLTAKKWLNDLIQFMIQVDLHDLIRFNLLLKQKLFDFRFMIHVIQFRRLQV